jgi:hypothetical protein
MEMEKMTERLLARIEPIRSELEGSIQHAMKSVLSYVDHNTQKLHRELADAIEETRMELWTAGVSLNKQAQDFEGQITSIREDNTCNERKLQAQLEEITIAAECGSRPAVCASVAHSTGLHLGMCSDASSRP